MACSGKDLLIECGFAGFKNVESQRGEEGGDTQKIVTTFSQT